MSSVDAKLLGTPLAFTFRDTVYEVKRLTIALCARYETVRAERARERLRQRKKEYTRKEYLAEQRNLDEAEDRGDYALMSPKTAAGLMKAENLRLLFSLLIPTATQEVLEAMLEERLEELLLLFNRLVKESFPQLAAKAKAKEAACPPNEVPPEPSVSVASSSPS